MRLKFLANDPLFFSDQILIFLFFEDIVKLRYLSKDFYRRVFNKKIGDRLEERLNCFNLTDNFLRVFERLEEKKKPVGAMEFV